MGIWLFFMYKKKDVGAKEFIESIREKHKPGFDSLQRAINYENDLNDRIIKSIKLEDFQTAYSLMDSLPPFGKTHSKHVYKGMIYAKQEKHAEAIREFTYASDEIPCCKARGLRAEVYIKMNKLDSALSDYKKIYEWNSDYSLQVANVFELKNNHDSALKYYNIYLSHYPNDKSVHQKVKTLK